MKLEHFYYVYEICRTGSINKAAKILYVSQPHLSNMIKDLESELNLKLFDRTARGIRPTNEGRIFAEYAEQIIELTEKVKAMKVLGTKGADDGFSIASIYSYTLLDLYGNYLRKKENPDTCISYSEMPVNKIVDAVDSKQATVGFMYYNDVDERMIKKDLANRKMTFHLLVSEPFCVVLNSEHPLFERESVSIAEMQNYSFIVENRAYEQHKKTFPSWFHNGRTAPVFFDNNRGAMYYLLRSENSFYMGQFSLNITNPFVVGRQLRYIPLSDTPYYVNTGYVTRDDTYVTETMRGYLEYVTDFFHEHCKN